MRFCAFELIKFLNGYSSITNPFAGAFALLTSMSYSTWFSITLMADMQPKEQASCNRQIMFSFENELFTNSKIKLDMHESPKRIIK